MTGQIRNVMEAICFIEDNLEENLDLETVARAVHYSKYHLHRMFTQTVGLTLHDYIIRRRLTEAARLLIFSDRPILEIALAAGYESQQAFTDIFKAMYKKSPNQYQEAEAFYPLQLRYILKENPGDFREKPGWQQKIAYGTEEDIPAWMELVRLVVDGFPYLDEADYLEKLRDAVRTGQALVLKDGDTAVGAMMFNRETGSIDFLGIHPQYQKQEIARAFCRKALYELSRTGAVTVTTFREGDRADTGYRRMLKEMGFAETELLVEFGYPTQRMILHKNTDTSGGTGK